MLVGLIVAAYVHLTRIARAAGSAATNIHAAVIRLSRHLDSHHWSVAPLRQKLLHQAAAMIGEDSLLVTDLTDVTKPT